MPIFFRDKSIGFPKFKSKKKNHKSYTTNVVNGNIKLGTGELVLPKLKAVKIKKASRDPSGLYPQIRNNQPNGNG